MFKKIVTLVLVLACMANLLAVPVFADEQPTADEATTTHVGEDYELVAKNEFAELYVNGKIGAFAVKNLKTGFVWYSAVPVDTYNRTDLRDANIHQLDSLFNIGCAMLNQNDDRVTQGAINQFDPKITVNKISNGASLTYYVKEFNIEIGVDIVLDGDSFVISVPIDKLVEGRGTVEDLNRHLEKIREFLDYCYNALDEIEEVGLSSNRSSIRKSRALLDELTQMCDSLDSVVGTAYTYSRAKVIILDTLQIYLFGGGDNDKGMYYRLLNSGKLSKKEKEHFEKQKEELQDLMDIAMIRFGQLKAVKHGGVVFLELLPNMGASNDYEDGYIFYPDGSGSITYNSPSHGVRDDIFETSIYSETKVNMAWENQRDATGLKRTMLPVYGVKKGNNAFAAIIEDGDTYASMVFIPSGHIFNLNRIYSKFTYRNKVQLTSSSQYASGMVTIFEKDPLKISPKVRFKLLSGDKANYSGMAEAYRQYLLDKSLIRKSPLIKKDSIPLALDFVVGVNKSMLLYERFIPLSSFEDISSVLDDLNNEGITNVFLHLQSWTKDLSAPTSFKVPSAVGGSKGLKALIEKSKSIGGNVFLQTDFVDADTWTRNIDESKLALDSNLRIFEFNTFWYKLFSPLYIRENVPKYLKQIEKLGNPGTANLRMGTLIYYDYNEKFKVNRSDTARLWAEIYEKFAAQSPTASYGGNQYILNNNDWLMDIPMSASGYTFTDESVPFYQMVVHGLIPYSAKPFNHFYDTQKEKLQTIEYGSIPLFKLTYRDASDLRKIYYEFTTPYDRVKSDIISIYKEFDENLAQFADQYMVRHEIIDDGVVVVTYSGGKSIYINYNQTEYTVGDVNIPALDYVIR
ncbi:MAG TPA: hypothetical protein GXX17_01215 [Clostridiales bacterium]|nr:hypothetical protein [Clostridiales bacterium]